MTFFDSSQGRAAFERAEAEIESQVVQDPDKATESVLRGMMMTLENHVDTIERHSLRLGAGHRKSLEIMARSLLAASISCTEDIF